MKLFTVWQFDKTTEDFRCQGIYMDDRDAARASEAAALPDSEGKLKNAPVVEHDSIEHLTEYLTKSRLGALADVLLRLEAEQHAAAPVPVVVEPPAPAAITETEPPAHVVLDFGHGTFVVDTGVFEGKPAVFIADASHPGEIGASATRELHALTELQPGERVLTFPTDEQAQAVAAALAPPPDHPA